MEVWEKEATFEETRNVLGQRVKVIFIEEMDTKKTEEKEWKELCLLIGFGGVGFLKITTLLKINL